MKFRNVAVGFATFLATSLGTVKVNGQNSGSDFQAQKDSLTSVIEKRYAGINVKNSQREAGKTVSEATLMANLGDSIYNEYMELVHEIFENKEVQQARAEAYTVQKGDPENLVALKKAAKKAYDDHQRSITLLNQTDEALQKYLMENPEITAEERDSLSVDNNKTNNPLLANKTRLEKELNHANAALQFVEKSKELEKADVALRIVQLNYDIFKKNEEVKKLNDDIKKWDRIQKDKDAAQAKLDALTLGDYDEQVKSKLSSENQEENEKMTGQNWEVASENLEKIKAAQGLDSEIKKYQTDQSKLGESREALENMVASLKSEILDDRAELKRMKKKKADHTIEDFVEQPYVDSDFQKSAVKFLDAYNAMRESKKNAADTDSVSEYQKRISEYTKQAKEVTSEDMDNGTKQSKYTIVDNNVEREIVIYEYLNGKKVIWDDDKISVYNEKGESTQEYQYNDNQYTNNKGQRVSTAAMIMNLGSGNLH